MKKSIILVNDQSGLFFVVEHKLRLSFKTKKYEINQIKKLKLIAIRVDILWQHFDGHFDRFVQIVTEMCVEIVN